MIYFSDNITTIELAKYVNYFQTHELNPGCLLLSRDEDNPQAFGVAKFNSDGDIVDIVEKPKNPPSKVAIGGIYLFDEQFWTLVDECHIEYSGNFSISDINRKYIQKNQVELLNIGKETWIDCGTPESLLAASIMAKEGKLNPNPFR